MGNDVRKGLGSTRGVRARGRMKDDIPVIANTKM